MKDEKEIFHEKSWESRSRMRREFSLRVSISWYESLVEVCNICSVRDENLRRRNSNPQRNLAQLCFLPLRTFKKGTCKVTKTNDYPEFTTLSERENWFPKSLKCRAELLQGWIAADWFKPFKSWRLGNNWPTHAMRTFERWWKKVIGSEKHLQSRLLTIILLEWRLLPVGSKLVWW